ASKSSGRLAARIFSASIPPAQAPITTMRWIAIVPHKAHILTVPRPPAMGKKSRKPEPEPAPRPADEPFLVVGLGASAGGINALQQFFLHTPADLQAAYVVVLHL